MVGNAKLGKKIEKIKGVTHTLSLSLKYPLVSYYLFRYSHLPTRTNLKLREIRECKQGRETGTPIRRCTG